MSIVTLNNRLLTVKISSLGAEVQSVTDMNGVERIWQRDPAYWTFCAPILFPMAGGLREDCYYLDGKRYEMPKHGFVRTAEWQIERADDKKAVFMINDKHPGFPFEYELRAIFELIGSSLMITYRVSNLDKQVFWYGIGSHEAFATPGGLEAYTLRFDEKETFANYVTEGNLINPVPVIMAENTDEFPLKTEYFAVDALVFRTLKSRGVTLESKLHDRRVRVDYPGHDVLMLWQKPGADYICIEPWVNAPDQTDSDMQIEHKPGCIRLAPGETTDRRHVITFE